MSNITISKWLFLVISMIYFQLTSQAQDSDLSIRILGTWVCDSIPDGDEGDIPMINTLKFTFEEGGKVQIELPDLEEMPSTMNGTWQVIENQEYKMELCFTFEDEMEELGPDCEEIFCEFSNDNYVLLTDREDDIYFRRE